MPKPKAGDKLAHCTVQWGGQPAQFDGLVTVARVTLTGQIVAGKLRFDEEGQGWGQGQRDIFLRWPTEADLRVVAERTRRESLVKRIVITRWDALPTEMLEAVAVALGPGPRVLGWYPAHVEVAS